MALCNKWLTWKISINKKITELFPNVEGELELKAVVYCADGKIEKNEMGGACGEYGRGERCAQGSGWET